jgi:hypothetical protein
VLAKEAHIECDIMTQDGRAVDEPVDLGKHLLQRWRAAHHLIRNPGQLCDGRRDWTPGLDQGVELTLDPPIVEPHRSDF